MKEYIPLNFDLIMNPFNWIIVALMVGIALAGVAFIFPDIVSSKKE